MGVLVTSKTLAVISEDYVRLTFKSTGINAAPVYVHVVTKSTTRT